MSIINQYASKEGDRVFLKKTSPFTICYFDYSGVSYPGHFRVTQLVGVVQSLGSSVCDGVWLKCPRNNVMRPDHEGGQVGDKALNPPLNAWATGPNCRDGRGAPQRHLIPPQSVCDRDARRDIRKGKKSRVVSGYRSIRDTWSRFFTVERGLAVSRN
jgi:hypothetical protein